MVRSELATIRGLRSRCSFFRAELADRGLDAETLRAHWPGGHDNPDHGFAGWIYCYGSYRTLLDGGSFTEEAPPPKSVAAERAALDIFRGAPIPAIMEVTDQHGVPRIRNVFPKSQHALLALELYDGDLGRLAAEYDALKHGAPSVFAAAAGAVLHGISHCQRIFAWIICHDGPGLPFSDDELNPMPPDWTAELSPVDHLTLVTAHRRLGARLALALQLIEPAQEGKSRPGSWSTIMAVASTELGFGTRTLTRDHTLESVALQLAVSREAKAAAHRTENDP